MKFNLIQPISCGNAVRLVVQPTASETRWRVLRKETSDFSGQDDPSAFVVHDGGDRFLTDSRLLINGVLYFYAIYGLTSLGWSAPVAASVTPVATFTDISLDAQELVRERLESSLHSMLQRGLITLTKPSVPVMSIPFYSQGTDLPVVTVLYGAGAATGHALGEQMSGDFKDDGIWQSAQGWLENITLEISAWSLNASERNTLRRAIEAAIAASLGVLEEQGLNMLEVNSVQDSEDFQSMNAPIYQTVIRLGCQITIAVTESDGSFTSESISILGV